MKSVESASFSNKKSSPLLRVLGALNVAAFIMASSQLVGCLNDNTGKSGAAVQNSLKGAGSTTPVNPGYSPAPSSGSSGSVTIISARVFQDNGSGIPTASPSASPSASASATASDGPMSTVAYFDSSSGKINLPSVCDASGSSSSSSSTTSKPCLCRYSWNEVNPTTNTGFTRTVDTSVTQVLNYSILCAAPTVWTSEIPDGTSVKLTVLPDTNHGNPVSFTSNTYVLTKQTTNTDAGDFRDIEGKAIKNIMHYVCYDYFSKDLKIDHDKKPGNANSPSGGSRTPPSVPLANRFKTSGTDYSSQSYWYDFYVRGNVSGSANESNSGFSCPRVRVNKNGSVTDQFFPGDSTFALALNSSKNYTIPVLSKNVLNISSSTGGGSGASTTTTGGSDASNGILGYATKPNSDGTCPAFVDSNGLTRRTFRLRKYIVNYPVRYKATGAYFAGSTQPINTVYIMDRPVDKTGQDPMKPLTRLGPKPCPFSFNTQWGSPQTAPTTTVTHACAVGTSKLPPSFSYGAMPPASFTPFLYGLPDGNKYGLSKESYGSCATSSCTYCMPNGTTGTVAGNYGNTVSGKTATCTGGATPSASFDDYMTPRNLDGTQIPNNKYCPIFPPPAANLTSQAALPIRPVTGFVPEFLEDTKFQACAFQSAAPVDADIVTVFNSYATKNGDLASDDPKKSRAFYCARTYPDPSWIVPAPLGSSFTKYPGNCDSGRPHGNDTTTQKYYIVKQNSTVKYNGYADLRSTTTPTASSRTVPDGLISAYAIMNERTYSCAYTYNPSLTTPYNSTLPLTDLVTPRSGCCQRCSGNSKSSNCSLTGASATAENRGIHSLVTALGPWYSRYGKPAFNMQSVLLSAAPYQIVPNQGALTTSNACYTATNTLLASDCQINGTAIVTGTWTNDTTGTPMGCIDPSEDP